MGIINSTMRDVVDQVAKLSQEAMEKMLIDQLGILVSEGLLVIERHEPMITIDVNNNLKVEHKARLHLKDKEYIQQLKEENITLQEKVEYLTDLVQLMRKAAKDILAEEDR